MEQDQEQLQIKVKEEDLKGAYSNLMQILHTKEEFVLDFFFTAPPQGILASRVIMNPAHVKRMVMALEDNLRKYEDKYGRIVESGVPEQRIGFVR